MTKTSNRELQPVSPNDLGEIGPKMRRLNDRQRLFVRHLVVSERRAGRQVDAARKAGYGTPTSKDHTLRQIAYRLMQDQKVVEAVAEESQKFLRAIVPEAVAALRRLINDPKHREHGRAVLAVVDRFDPIETRHVVDVHKRTQVTVVSTSEALKKINELAARAGLVPSRLPPLLEHEGRAPNDDR
jgi:phage terminase small subunit